MSVPEIAGLIAAAMAGGAINAVAGGGTLVTFPTLLFFQTPPVVANATSTLALVIGTSGAVFGYRRHLDKVKPWLWRFVPVSVIGGLLGSLLLTQTSNQTFAKLVPFLILFATLIFLAQGLARRVAGLDRAAGVPGPLKDTQPGATHRAVWAAIAFQLAVAIYGGYFGAGIGILMLASLGFIGMGNISEINTLKTVLNSLINLVAAVWFIFAGLIDWPKCGVMILGSLAGYFLGSHYSQRIPPQKVRHLITAIGFILTAVTFYEEFVK